MNLFKRYGEAKTELRRVQHKDEFIHAANIFEKYGFTFYSIVIDEKTVGVCAKLYFKSAK